MKKKIWLLILLFTAVVAFGLYFFIFKKDNHKSYKETQIRRSDIAVTILTTGTVQPENRLEIKPPVAGRVDQVLVKEGQQVKKGQVLAWMSSAERAALIDSARAQGADEVKKWEELYKPTPVIAPISGMIILKNVESGQTFTMNDAVLVMSNRLTVKAQVDETDLAQIKINQNCEIRLDSYPETKIPAKVSLIAYEAKTVSNVTTYIVQVLPDQVPDFMRSGMTANVTFFIETKKQVLVVPTEFIKYDNGKPTVLVKSEKEPLTKEIQIGTSDGKQTEIISGVAEGDSIILVTSREGKNNSSNPLSPFGSRNSNRSSGGRGR